MNILTHPLFLLGVFATACYVLTFITRRVVETAKPSFKKQADENDAKVTYSSGWARWWNQVILYAIAPAWGALLAFFLRDNEYFPASFRELDAALMFGLGTGFLCGFLFKLLKRLLAKEVGVDIQELEGTSDPPVPPGE